MTKILLVRHGQTEWNTTGRFQGQSDIELTKTGVEQAEKAAAYLADEAICAVYASDLKRATETARRIGARHALFVSPLPALREIFFGDWEGLTYEEIKKDWPDEIDRMFSAPSTLAIPHGETFRDVAARAVPAVDALAKKHEGKTILLVSHGATIRTIIGHYLHMPLDFIWSLCQDNTAINRLSFDGGRVVVELLNSTEHLKR